MAYRLILYNSAYNVSTPAQLMATNLAYAAHPDATLKDVAGITTNNITAYIATLTDDYYTDIYICCATQLAGATGLVSFDQVASLRAKMITANKGTTVRANTCQANVTTTDIILDASASASNDTYNAMFIVTDGVTDVYRYIQDYTGASKTCLVTDTGTAITSTETFVVYTNTHIFELGNIDAATAKTPAYLMWENLWPNTPVPCAVNYLGGYLFCECSGTATAVAAGTITLDATGATRSVGDAMTLAQMVVADAVKDMWVYIYSASTGAWQSRKITASAVTTAVCTLESNWDVTPTGTVVYRVVSQTEKQKADRAMEIWAKAVLWNPAALEAKQAIEKLTNYYGELDTNLDTEVSQDLTFLSECVKLGDFAFRADATLYI
jgi:hypothetical protein